MLATLPSRRQARCLRWKPAPWDQQHPDWQRLDQELPSDHGARLIDRAVDLLDLQPFLALFCAGFGSASWPPALLLKLALYEAQRKVHSPAQWWRDCSEHLPLRWLLRGAKPSRATLYDCRRRLSPRLLKRLNRQVLLTARQEKLCPAQRASLDGTFVAARSSRHQMLTLKRLDKRIELLQKVLAADEGCVTDQGSGVQTRPPRWLATSPQGRQRQLARYQQARLRLLQKRERHQQRQNVRAKKDRQPPEWVKISPCEPAAAIGKDKSKVVRPLYDVQLLRDLDSPFLLGYGVFASNSDAGLLPKMLVQAKMLCGSCPEKLLADSIYASIHDLRVCQRRQVTLYAPAPGGPAAQQTPSAAPSPTQRQSLPVVSSETPVAQPAPDATSPSCGQPLVGSARPAAGGKKKYYGKEMFVWQSETNSYLCPAGERLERLSRGRAQRVHGSQLAFEKYGTKECVRCPQREQCTRSQRGRQIKRLLDEPLVEQLRERMDSVAGRQLYRLRKQTIEREFADMTEHRGLRRFSGFGQQLGETQVGLLVLLHNLKALLQGRQTALEQGRQVTLEPDRQTAVEAA